MAGAVLLSEWNTVRGAASTTTVTQQEKHYADLLHFQDVVIFMETSDVSGTPLINFQTSPTKDDILFQLIDAAASFVPTVSPAVTTKVLRYSAVTVPLARYVRWKFMSGVAAWSCTFRVWLSPNLS